jgi:hypothetical protein
MARMARNLVRCGVLTLVVAALSGCGISSITGSKCPYGKSDAATDGTGCAPRTAPTAAESAAAVDGSALEKGLAAFKNHKDAGKGLNGVGLSRWGDTTFAVRTGDVSDGEREKFHTFDRNGAVAPKKQELARGYELVYSISFSVEGFAPSLVKPAVVSKAIAQVKKGAPEAVFFGASLAADKTSALVWNLRFAKSSKEDVGAMILRMNPDGSGLCSLGKISAVRGIPDCKSASQTAPGFPSSPSTSSPQTSSPSAPTETTTDIQKEIAEQMECVRKAGTDSVAIQKCVGQ